MFHHFHNKICQACHKRPAKIKFVKIVDSQWQEALICPVCAQSIANHEKAGAHLKFDHVMEAFLAPKAGEAGAKIVPAGPGAAPAPAADAMCPSCGLSYSNYRPTLMLGCSECYEAFGALLRDDLRRIHGAAHHAGRRPPDDTPAAARMPALGPQGEAAARVAPDAPPAPAAAAPAPPSPSIAPVVPAAPPEDFLGAPPTVADPRAHLRKLRRDLKEAIEGEDFEVAARLRDRIRDFEKTLGAAEREGE